MIQICKGNHIKDAERFIWAEGPHSCQVKHNVRGVRSRDLRVLVLAHHTLSFRVALVYRESPRCSSCSNRALPKPEFWGAVSLAVCFMTISWTVNLQVRRLHHSFWAWAKSVNPWLRAQCQFLLLESWTNVRGTLSMWENGSWRKANFL